MIKQSTSPFRAFALAGVGVLLAWQVTTRSLVAYLATAAPETALSLRSTDPRALLNLADAEFANSQAGENGRKSGRRAFKQAGEDTSETSEQASDRLRHWAELASKMVHKGLDKPHSPDEPSGSTESRALSLDRETSELIRGWTEVALINDPLNARALSILGQLATAAGDEQGAGKFLRAAADRSIRERVAVYWLMRTSYESREYASAIYHADTLLRTRSQAALYVMPILLQMAESKDAHDELKRTLINNPPWRSNFLSTLAQKAADPRATLELLFAIRDTATPPTTEDLRNYVNALVGRKQHELAYYAWLEFLLPEQLSSTGFLFNGSFELTPSGLPFDWVIGDGTGVTIDIIERPQGDGQRALLIEFGHGRVEFPRVQQLTMLAPGAYEFRASYKGELLGKRGLVWRVACAARPNAPIGESSMATGASPKWKEIEFTFTVPATDCRAQQVRLELDARMASEQLVSGSIWYDDLRIVPADRIDRR